MFSSKTGYRNPSNTRMLRCKTIKNAHILAYMLRFLIVWRLEAYINNLKLDMSSRYAGPSSMIWDSEACLITIVRISGWLTMRNWMRA